MQQRRALMTELATQAMDLSDTFNIIFENRFVGLTIDLAKPGMSTAGGKQAVQHIAMHAQGGGSLVIGSVDTKTKRADLRSYDRLISMHRQRFGTELPIAEADWMSFLERAEKFLREEGLAVTREAETVGGSPADFGERQSTAPRTVPVWVAVVIAAVLIVLAIVVTLALRP